MSFNQYARGWWKFDQSLNDEVATNDFELQSGAYPTYGSFQNFNLTDGLTTKHGLLFQTDNTFSATVGSLEVPAAGGYTVGISFWYYSPGAVGQVRHVTTQELTNKSAPLLAKADTLVAGGYEQIVDSGGEWIITEIGVSNSQNAIQILICDAMGQPTHRIISEAYLPGLHYIYVTIDTQQSVKFYIRIDIDGKFGEQYSLSVDLPDIKNTGVPIWINKCNYGWTAHHTTQVGAFISDLAILAIGQPNSDHVIRTMRFGVQNVLSDDIYYGPNSKYSFLGIGYTQPETVTTTKIFSEGGHVFCARSNGEVLEGHKPIWNNDFTFTDQNSISQLSVVGSADGLAQWTPQGLYIKGASIRI